MNFNHPALWKTMKKRKVKKWSSALSLIYNGNALQFTQSWLCRHYIYVYMHIICICMNTHTHTTYTQYIQYTQYAQYTQYTRTYTLTISSTTTQVPELLKGAHEAFPNSALIKDALDLIPILEGRSRSLPPLSLPPPSPPHLFLSLTHYKDSCRRICIYLKICIWRKKMWRNMRVTPACVSPCRKSLVGVEQKTGKEEFLPEYTVSASFFLQSWSKAIDLIKSNYLIN